MSRMVAVFTCLLLATNGASAAADRPDATGAGAQFDRRLMADYVRRLPVGARVTVALVDGTTLRGTLMQATDEGVVVQRRTRLPEQPVTIPLDAIARVELDAPSSAGKTIAIGVAAGAAATLGVLLLVAALVAD